MFEEEEEDTILKQLKQTKTNTSVKELLVASKKHMDAMYEALENLLVSIKSTPEDLFMLVGFKDNVYSSFFYKDLIDLGRKHN